jgi:hypothetical protein
MDIADIGAGRLAKAFSGKEQEFEDFFGELVREECQRRHRAPTIRGPVKNKKADGGRDVSVVVKKPPRVSLDEFPGQALTWDDLGETRYSCKTGGSWKSSVQRDFAFPAKKNTTSNKPPSKELLDHLESGGRYVVVTSEQTGGEPGWLDKLAEAAEFWISNRSGAQPPALREQFDLIDANDLAAFLKQHRPQLSSGLREVLELSEPDGLRSWEEWTQTFARERHMPEFVIDDERERLLSLLATPVGSNDRIVRIVGPPGVGKTRVVYEALSREPDARRRVRYTDSFDRAKDAFDGSYLKSAGARVMVVDEIATHNVDGLARAFLMRADPGARLILIGTRDGDVEHVSSQTDVRLFDLEGLTDDAARQLVSKEFGVSVEDRDGRVDVVLSLSEGYPWFAVLLAHALVKDGESLAAGTDESLKWGGAQRVLAGASTDYASRQEWKHEAESRAKCLLSVLLTGHLDSPWREICGQHGPRLAAALRTGDDWEAVVRAETECRGRGLLRRVGSSNRTYVSPNNLARIILNHYFSGPDDLGPSVREHLPEFRERLHRLAERVHATTAVRRSLARGEWNDLWRLFSRNGIGAATAYVANVKALLHAAREEPEIAARTVAEIVSALTGDELTAASGFCESVRPVLEHVIHRRLPLSLFEGVETALFRLAQVEQQGWAKNSIRTWHSLFLVALSLTYQPWEVRFELLRRRCRSEDAGERLFAVEALGAAVSHDERGLVYTDWDAVDGEWPSLTCSEYHAAKRDVWHQLVATCADPDDRVCGKARDIVATSLRGGLTPHHGLDANLMRDLVESVGGWSAEEKSTLAEAIDDVHRYDLEHITEETQSLLKELQEQLLPSTFAERLIAQVGSWHPGPWSITDPNRSENQAVSDGALVGESLSEPCLLTPHLAWLESAKAKRSPQFLRTLGRGDTRRVFLPQLEQRYPRSLRTLSAYLLGWAEADDCDALGEWIANAVSDPAYDPVLGSVLSRLSPTNQTIEWLLEIVTRGGAGPDGLLPLGYTNTLVERVDPRLLERLIRAAIEEPGLVEVALAMLHSSLPAARGADPEGAGLMQLAAACLERGAHRSLGTMAGHHWIQIAERLLFAGARTEVVRALSVLLKHALETHNIRTGEEALGLVLESDLGEALWLHAADELLPSAASWILRDANILSYLVPSVVLDWVGADEARAVQVAALGDVYSETLSPVLVTLLSRFGATSRVGAELTGRVFSTPRPVHDFGVFYERQRANAEQWAKIEVSEVRTWAESVIVSLDRRIEEERARAQYARRYA